MRASGDSPERAVTFGQFLLSSTKRLADFPEMGRVVPQFGDLSLRVTILLFLLSPRRFGITADDADGRGSGGLSSALSGVKRKRLRHGARGTPGI